MSYAFAFAFDFFREMLREESRAFLRAFLASLRLFFEPALVSRRVRALQREEVVRARITRLKRPTRPGQPSTAIARRRPASRWRESPGPSSRRDRSRGPAASGTAHGASQSRVHVNC